MKLKVCIDAGHGGGDPGALGPKGTREKDINLIVAHLLKERLEKLGHKTMMTRHKDVFVSIGNRAGYANSNRADCFVSIHCNSATVSTAHGWEIFTSIGQTRADSLATSIHQAWVSLMPKTRVRADWSDGDVDKEADLGVLRLTRMPAVLVELAFIKNPAEEIFLLDPANQRIMAKGIADGVNAWGM
jgi:N-acetylmuramoyl-L-alanine amidase